MARRPVSPPLARGVGLDCSIALLLREGHNRRVTDHRDADKRQARVVLQTLGMPDADCARSGPRHAGAGRALRAACPHTGSLTARGRGCRRGRMATRGHRPRPRACSCRARGWRTCLADLILSHELEPEPPVVRARSTEPRSRWSTSGQPDHAAQPTQHRSLQRRRHGRGPDHDHDHELRRPAHPPEVRGGLTVPQRHGVPWSSPPTRT